MTKSQEFKKSIMLIYIRTTIKELIPELNEIAINRILESIKDNIIGFQKPIIKFDDESLFNLESLIKQSKQ